MLNIIRGQAVMNHHVVYNEQILSIAQDVPTYVTTVLLCQNTLIHSGISHILSGTHFVISEEIPELTTGLPILCLIHGSQAADDLIVTVERLKAQWPSARVVLLTEHMEPAAMVQALQTGLDGLCSTAMKREALIKALELVMLGEPFIAPALVFSLVDEALHHQTRPDGNVMVGPAATAVASKLSPRESMILHHLTQGASNKQIARELGLAEATVKVHLKGILRKVKAANRTQAAMWAQQHMKLAANDGIIAAAE
ncbi:response regulator transcription factor [Microvirga sp. BT689]|uniref:LuxR C-terminal-related transcriptional regulator n=1 Tax=Microvirga arvi TaxID=2778731 RepID=UPI00194E24D7|nr:response regulator transcription factor [Microvirga arvi]MBM6583658.1 response regulator transcription factor [Microvirga arvi]